MPTSRRGAGVGFALITGLIALFAFAPSAWAVEPGGPSGDGIQPYVVEDANGDPVTNPDCEDALGPGYFQLKDDNPGAGNKTLADSYMSVALVYGTFPTADPHGGESYVNFTATKGVDAVIVKGGQPGNAFVYTPESKDDTLLHPPINPNNGKYFGISHVDVCYDIELEVSKTATTSFKRDYDWKVSKTNDTTGTVNVAPGEPYKVNYEVTAGTNGYVDSDFAVSGNITVKNPHPTATANSVQVTDELFDGTDVKIADGTVTCPKTTLAPGETMTCSYTASLTSATNGTNKATTTTTTAGIGLGSGTAAFTFGAPTTVVDDCVQVSDDRKGALGQVCVNESPKKFNYSETFSFTTDQCGENKITNTAKVDQTTGTDPTASSDVIFNVRCAEVGGCTLTQGYWKTHSLYGPAPYDNAWLAIGPSGADTTFFLSGKTWYQVFWTPPAGNAYYNLAHQYMAAKLNRLNGASSTPAVDAAIAGAEAFFAVKTPASSLTNAQKNQIKAWAATLDQYNNGLIGPGHCSESIPA